MRLVDLLPQMLRVLSKAQELRSQKSDFIGDELEWVIYEREVMLQAINAVRLQRNQPAVLLEQVKRIENCAKGHIDYSHKFALYAAELALKEST
jgi:hypothetical protein